MGEIVIDIEIENPASEKLLCPKAGTATSSPGCRTSSPSFEDSALVNVLWWMKKNGYAESTIEATGTSLRILAKNCALCNHENMKGFIANKECSNGSNETLFETYYDLFLYSMGWKRVVLRL